MNVTRCRSCGQKVIWAVTERGKHMPVDAEPHPAGNITLIPRPDGGATAHVLQKFESAGGELYRSHFVICPNASDWRRKDTP
jgi:hypothetical protein